MRAKTLVLSALLAVAPLSQAMADKDIGCGWGTLVWKGKSGMGPKILGATTNGSFGNQTFGITSGTAGCSSQGVITADARVSKFASANMDRLVRDMAAGQGESLATLAHLLNIAETDRPAFYNATKAHFAEIFSSSDVTTGQMLESLAGVVAKDATLAKYVM